MNIPIQPLALATALALAVACSPATPAAEDAVADAPAPSVATVAADAPSSVAAPQLQEAMRSLWHGHIVHAREYAMAVHAGDAPAASAAADAVVANAGQIADAVAGFYGEAAGARMLELLGGHWGAVKDLTDARAAGDQDAADRAVEALTANAGGIARFLAGANPNLPEDTVRGLLLAHGGHHARQIEQVMADDTAGEAATWVAMQEHMDVIADALAGAIAKQFPDKAG